MDALAGPIVSNTTLDAAVPTAPLESVPFAEILQPWVREGERRLEAHCPDLDQRLDRAARLGLVRQLQQELSFAVTPSLFDAFQRWPRRRSFSARSRSAYLRFIDEVRHETADSALTATLVGLLDLLVAKWCRHARLFLERLESDRALVNDRFALTGPLAALAPLSGGSYLLTDRSGSRVVYKNRSVGMDAALGALLRWVNTHASCDQLCVPELVDRGEFGWMREIPCVPPQNRQARERYYERMGLLLCVAHVLGAGDLHAANVQAFGEDPVILDAEVLLRPRRTRTTGRTPSVLATGLLPTAAHLEFCGLACEHFTRSPEWLDAGTDGMRLRASTPYRAQRQRVVCDRIRRDGTRATASLTRGFSRLYRGILERPLPLDLFERARPRVLLRPTRHYVDAMAASVEPAHLSPPGRRVSVLTAAVSERPAALEHHAGAADAVREVEWSALLRLDVPRFSMRATGGPIYAHGRPLGAVFEEAPLDRARRLMRDMSLSALDDQCRVIAAAMSAAKTS
jgi:lantibiotic modifying enzyme